MSQIKSLSLSLLIRRFEFHLKSYHDHLAVNTDLKKMLETKCLEAISEKKKSAKGVDAALIASTVELVLFNRVKNARHCSSKSPAEYRLVLRILPFSRQT